MPTENCPECEPGKPCGQGHLYVLQLDAHLPGAKGKKGTLYVGSTGKSVEERFRDNFGTKDGEFFEPAAVRSTPEAFADRDWKYRTTSSKQIRKHPTRHRPDLYRDRNPVPHESSDPKRLERLEARLADKLRRRGWSVGGPSRKR